MDDWLVTHGQHEPQWSLIWPHLPSSVAFVTAAYFILYNVLCIVFLKLQKRKKPNSEVDRDNHHCFYSWDN